MSAPSGFPTSKKSLSSIAGYTNDQTQVQAQFNTIQPTGSDRFATDVTQRVAYLLETATTAANCQKRLIKTAAPHNARKGDIIKFKSGALLGLDAPVLSVPDTSTIILATELDAIPAGGVSFEICRYTFWKTNSDGELQASSGPLRIIVDGVDTELKLDTANPANNIPLPTINQEAKLVNGDVDDYTFDNVSGVTLYTGVAKKVRLVQNGGELLYIYKGLTKIGALEAGGKIEFFADFALTDSLIIKSKAGTVTTNICWNVFA